MGRFDHRYWNGTAWTDSVSRSGIQHEDPVSGPSEPETASTFEAGASTSDTELIAADDLETQTAPKRKGRGLVIVALVFIGLLGTAIAIALLNKGDDPKPALSESISLSRAHDVLGQSVPRLRTALAPYSSCASESLCIAALRTAYSAAQDVELDATVLSDPAHFTFPDGYRNDLNDLDGAVTAFTTLARNYLRCTDGPSPDHCDNTTPGAGLNLPESADYLGTTLYAFEK